MLLSMGNTVYCGDARASVDWFRSLGYMLPENYNPADYYMNLLSDVHDEFDDHDRLENLV